MTTTKIAFISYRREDSSAAARSLRENLFAAFGDAIFMDIDEIRVGNDWPQDLERALSSASVLLVVIGPTWLRLSDQYGRRRLDLPNDWVRTEIERAIGRKIPIVPVIVGRATMPPREALPAAIADLSNHQYVALRESHWKEDLQPLVDVLSSAPLSFPRAGSRVPVPVWSAAKRPETLPRALEPDEIQQALARHPGWTIVRSPLPGDYPKERVELHRVFRFADFDHAIDFMSDARPFINRTNHHPRWENVFRAVSVWLSTWDVGHRISKLDLALAAHLDELHAKVVSAAQAPSTGTTSAP